MAIIMCLLFFASFSASFALPMPYGLSWLTFCLISAVVDGDDDDGDDDDGGGCGGGSETAKN